MFLSKYQINQFSKFGYVIINNFANQMEINRLKLAALNICRTTPLSEVGGFFTAKKGEEDKNHHKITKNHQYLIDSSDKIKIFLEEGIDTKTLSNDNLHLYTNKIGHALHLKNQVFQEFTNQDRIFQICQDLNQIDPMTVQSMYILKPPLIGGPVKPHQDNSYLYTHPPTCLGFCLPIQDSTRNNGCLWAIPGSNRFPLRTRFMYLPEYGEIGYYPKDEAGGSATAFLPLDEARGNESGYSTFLPLEGGNFIPLDGVRGNEMGNFIPLDGVRGNEMGNFIPLDGVRGNEMGNFIPLEGGNFVPLEMDAGDLLVFHGNLVHKSEANKSEISRHAYTFHSVSKKARWCHRNWLQLNY